MGLIGSQIGKGLGGLLGEAAGKHYGGDKGGSLGRHIGEYGGELVGNLLPFKNGGKVPGKKGKPRMILAHGGETVLPVGVKPTAAQKKAIKMLGGKC